MAEKKLKLEDAMCLLPDSEVRKIKAITKKLEEKKKMTEEQRKVHEQKRYCISPLSYISAKTLIF